MCLEKGLGTAPQEYNLYHLPQYHPHFRESMEFVPTIASVPSQILDPTEEHLNLLAPTIEPKETIQVLVGASAEKSSEEPASTGASRKYTRDKTDTKKVQILFKEYIRTCGAGEKGSLPGVKLVKEFLAKNSLFHGFCFTEQQKVSLVKTKVFNERKTYRDKAMF